ncbi:MULTISPECIES: Lrp/AsnC family transcriptional regulator [unclassified Rhizobium]|uniref:Lrp/AsnC family transcriptional regulator n=1 Tax=unclassified Rhizobium TaxID=2613769 RepID=UPI000DDE767B|nr:MULTISPECIES: Lrp/AsnC family transcriptional regulator [unclassified Rhizobium]MBB3290750.1 DNA-binding Lrp family transcriptional regulator [Rhizobium sp. BK252]MBB3405530.1 DNA-binding Lrp family transcriptional regulator [Rhizobium sp. BK289]MBB3418180.1 DNA-binding Lrp family transcriptional regulator [Rhizobium sp. BK284]MBB3486059.1 DNA-binding Lrp family transcriptional regulator [Rhizobium sp. BK347]MDK4721357.1 Lrp/AsnC family transcriptional regulator [Rhizobium sp. CNPSo 3968]
MRKSADLDEFDLAILDLLQKDSTVPQRKIGELVNLSAPAVQRRIKRLQESGVIQANIAVIDPAAMGLPITIIVEVHIANERYDLINAIKRSFLEAPEVQQCYQVTGEADFVLVVVVASMSAYEALTRRLFYDNPNVTKFKSLVAMDRVKIGLSLPLRRD